MTGSLAGQIGEERFPDAQILYFNSYPDMTIALQQRTIDGFLIDLPRVILMMQETPGISYIPEEINSYEYALGYSKTLSPEISSRLNAFVNTLAETGKLKDMEAKWTGPDQSVKKLEIRPEELTGDKGTIQTAVDSTHYPFTFLADGGELVGFGLDIVTQFATEYGYRLELTDVGFGSVLAGLSAGRFDLACIGIMITEERKESMDFSLPYYVGGFVMAVSDGSLEAAESDEQEAPKGLISGLKDGFEKTFLREERYKIFVNGILTTILITICSAVFGTLLGFGIYMLNRTGNPVVLKVTKIYTWFIKGIPTVVLLMILYYLVFGHTSMSGTWIAIIGFTLVFGAGIYGLICIGVETVSIGQTEAALALGYKKTEASCALSFRLPSDGFSRDT